jgi:hypothetical protein
MQRKCTNCEWRTRWTILLALCLFGHGLLAEDLPCRRTAPVTVTDLRGKPILRLAAGDFVGHLRGTPIAVLSANTDTNVPRIALLLDASGSVLDSPESWGPALTIAHDLVDRLAPGSPLAFFVFASQVDKMVDFTPERGPVLQQIDELQAGRKVLTKGFRRTSLWDTVVEAFKSFGSPQVGDAIYAITDGGDNGSKADLGNVEKALLSAGVRFFAILPPPHRGFVPPEEQYGPTTLNELAQATGGFLMKSYKGPFGGPLGPDQLGLELDLLYTWTFHFYRLELEVMQPVNKAGDWRLEVVDPTHRATGRNFVLGYPHKIATCPVADNAH